MDEAAPKSRVVRRESIPPPPGNGSSPDARSLDEFVQNLRETVRVTVDEDIKFYKRTVKWPRLAAQLVTSLTIIVAAVLPFLAAADYPNKAVIVGAASVTVAVLTGLAAYWRWTDEWRGYVIALVTLNYLRAGWELELAEASLLPPDKAREASVPSDDQASQTSGRIGAPRDIRAFRFAGPSHGHQGRPGVLAAHFAPDEGRRRFLGCAWTLRRARARGGWSA